MENVNVYAFAWSKQHLLGFTSHSTIKTYLFSLYIFIHFHMFRDVSNNTVDGCQCVWLWFTINNWYIIFDSEFLFDLCGHTKLLLGWGGKWSEPWWPKQVSIRVIPGRNIPPYQHIVAYYTDQSSRNAQCNEKSSLCIIIIIIIIFIAKINSNFN